MNLVAYDKVDSIVDTKKSWINVLRKCIYSRELPYKKYVSFGKTFDTSQDTTKYYIILTNEKPYDRPCSNVILTSNGLMKIDIKGLWNEAGFCNIKSKYFNITLTESKDNDDCRIFEFMPYK